MTQIVSKLRAVGHKTNRGIREAHAGRKELERPGSRSLRFRFWSSKNRTHRAHASYGYTRAEGGYYPTEPSISSSISRLSSTLYSIGNWRTRSLTKPLTLKLIACALVRPRCCM